MITPTQKTKLNYNIGMTKQHNILGERPRRKNNKVLLNIGLCEKPKKSRMMDSPVGIIFQSKDISYADFVKEMEDYITLSKEKPELNFWQALAVIVVVFLTLFTGFKFLQRAMDINALNTCEDRGDCTEVIRDINAH